MKIDRSTSGIEFTWRECKSEVVEASERDIWWIVPGVEIAKLWRTWPIQFVRSDATLRTSVSETWTSRTRGIPSYILPWHSVVIGIRTLRRYTQKYDAAMEPVEKLFRRKRCKIKMRRVTVIARWAKECISSFPRQQRPLLSLDCWQVLCATNSILYIFIQRIRH